MFDVTKLPCLREHFEQVAAAEEKVAAAETPPVEYADAPDGPGYQSAGRPPAIQGVR